MGRTGLRVAGAVIVNIAGAVIVNIASSKILHSLSSCLPTDRHSYSCFAKIFKPKN